MELYQAVILGLVQGFAEFLPISSSGHLVLFQSFFGLTEPEIFFDICLHVGTLAAVVFYFRKDLYDILASVMSRAWTVGRGNLSVSEALRDPNVKQAIFITAALVPTALAGLLIEQVADILFTSVIITGVMLIITGAVLWPTRRYSEKNGSGIENSLKKAFIIGLVQGLAVIPGISRSGSTIAAGLFLGMDRESAARFSFLMSIPAIAGAAVLSLKDVEHITAVPLHTIIPGMIVACFSGYLALTFLVFIVKKGHLYVFAPYCWLAGILAVSSRYII